MSSIAKRSSQPNIHSINHNNSTIFTTPKWPSSRRTPSLSSSPSFSSNSSSSFRSFSLEEDFSQPNSPSTSLDQTLSSSGIPFSWETIPGIPKKQTLKKIDSSRQSNYLPLPPAPATTTVPTKKSSHHHKKHCITRRDPFFNALVECSKGGDDEEDDNMWKTAKNLSTRFGFVNMSCKNSSAVAESLVFLPTRSAPRRISYDILKKRTG